MVRTDVAHGFTNKAEVNHLGFFRSNARNRHYLRVRSRGFALGAETSGSADLPPHSGRFRPNSLCLCRCLSLLATKRHSLRHNPRHAHVSVAAGYDRAVGEANWVRCPRLIAVSSLPWRWSVASTCQRAGEDRLLRWAPARGSHCWVSGATPVRHQRWGSWYIGFCRSPIRPRRAP